MLTSGVYLQSSPYVQVMILLEISWRFSRFCVCIKSLSTLLGFSSNLWSFFVSNLKLCIPSLQFLVQVRERRLVFGVWKAHDKNFSHLLSWNLEHKPCCMKAKIHVTEPYKFMNLLWWWRWRWSSSLHLSLYKILGTLEFPKFQTFFYIHEWADFYFFF